MTDADTQNMVLFALYRAIQAAIDLGQHVALERRLAVPATHREVFEVLGRAGAIDAELAERMQGWAGLRNVIAHLYAEIDMQLVASALYAELDDLERFASAMAALAPGEPEAR